MRVIYDTTEDCTHCPYNTGRVCMKLRKYLFDICFEKDCPLPTLEEVEKFTRYIRKDGDLKVHGNCKHWKRWGYNKHFNCDIGSCERNGINFASHQCCEGFDEV